MDEKELEHFKFKVKKGKMTLVEYTVEEEKVVIPDEFQRQAVTVIGKESFCFGKANCVEVVFPKSLEVIEPCAFENCDSMINREGYILFHSIIFNYAMEQKR